MARAKRKTWWDLLSTGERKHLRKDANVHSVAGLVRTLNLQAERKMVCHDCRHVAQVLRRERPDLGVPEPLPWSVLRPDWD